MIDPSWSFLGTPPASVMIKSSSCGDGWKFFLPTPHTLQIPTYGNFSWYSRNAAPWKYFKEATVGHFGHRVFLLSPTSAASARAR
jgi:hypothetical protein